MNHSLSLIFSSITLAPALFYTFSLISLEILKAQTLKEESVPTRDYSKMLKKVVAGRFVVAILWAIFYYLVNVSRIS